MMKALISGASGMRSAIRTSGLHATILRPWYVLGPVTAGLIPNPGLLGAGKTAIDARGAQRLGLVTLEQMLQALATPLISTDRSARPWCTRHSSERITGLAWFH